jgi:hypothetical protein
MALTMAPAPAEVKLIQLRAGYAEAWLGEYTKILLPAAEDFLRRAQLPGTAAGVLDLLREAARSRDGAAWLLFTPDYRLRGWAVAWLLTPLGGPLSVDVAGMHVYPKGAPPGAFQALVRAVRGWAAETGATVIYFTSRRGTARLWARQVGAEPVATVYRAPVEG